MVKWIAVYELTDAEKEKVAKQQKQLYQQKRHLKLKEKFPLCSKCNINRTKYSMCLECYRKQGWQDDDRDLLEQWSNRPDSLIEQLNLLDFLIVKYNRPPTAVLSRIRLLRTKKLIRFTCDWVLEEYVYYKYTNPCKNSDKEITMLIKEQSEHYEKYNKKILTK